VKTVERKAEWPDWMPPAEMIARSPYLPRFMAGGATNAAPRVTRKIR
jgi:lipoprotein-anchoring transpeptidase ErfK/SrfK